VTAGELAGYAGLCGRTLAHAHAKTDDRHMIAGYLGKGDAFVNAMVNFADAHANQNEIDYALFKQL
jgi:hypothetical protein